MTCQPVTLSDGSIVLVNVKPGQTLLPEDVAALEEFRRLLAMAPTGERMLTPADVMGQPAR
jgi:hypothetical protein